MITYMIRPGDTLYRLAAQFHTTYEAILAANPGVNPYGLLVGQTVSIPVEGSAQPAPRGGELAKALLINGINLRNALRRLWMEHVAWTRMAIISMAENLKDVDFVSARLLRNADDMAAALSPLYGEAAANRFGSLIREHLNIAAQLVKAVKAGDTAAAQAAEKSWYANADEIAAFLSGINPYISKDAFTKMLYEHLALTKEEAARRLAGKYQDDIALYDRIEEQALRMADAMADAIIRQFPSMFA